MGGTPTSAAPCVHGTHPDPTPTNHLYLIPVTLPNTGLKSHLVLRAADECVPDDRQMEEPHDNVLTQCWNEQRPLASASARPSLSSPPIKKN